MLVKYTSIITLRKVNFFKKTCEAYKKALWPFNVLEFEMSNDDVYNSWP